MSTIRKDVANTDTTASQQPLDFTPDDAADALAVALCYLNQLHFHNAVNQALNEQ